MPCSRACVTVYVFLCPSFIKQHNNTTTPWPPYSASVFKKLGLSPSSSRKIKICPAFSQQTGNLMSASSAASSTAPLIKYCKWEASSRGATQFAVLICTFDCIRFAARKSLLYHFKFRTTNTVPCRSIRNPLDFLLFCYVTDRSCVVLYWDQHEVDYARGKNALAKSLHTKTFCVLQVVLR